MALRQVIEHDSKNHTPRLDKEPNKTRDSQYSYNPGSLLVLYFIVL